MSDVSASTVPLADGLPALDGLLVLELGAGLPTVLAGMLLADNGARVIKLEPTNGSADRARAGHRVWNRGKQSICLDLQQPREQEIFDKLMARADVAVWDADAPPQAVPSECLRESFSKRYPRLITCEASGYGPTGPLAGLPASDALMAALTGRCSDQTGWSPGPSHVVAPMASLAAALLLVQGATAALLVRATTGLGQHVSTSLLGASLAISGATLSASLPTARGLSPDPRGSAPFYAAYPCQDGEWLQIGCLHGGFVRRAIQVLDSDGALARLATDPGFGDGVVIHAEPLRVAVYAAVERALLRR